MRNMETNNLRMILRMILPVIVLILLQGQGYCLGSEDHLLQETLDRLVKRNRGYGGGVFRVSDGRRVLWEGAAGQTAGPGSAPISPSTPFEIASITKAVTAATVLKLVEGGRLRLDARLGDSLPADQARGFDPDITISQLLTHTSGLAHYWTDGPKDLRGSNAFLREFLARPERFWKPGEILEFARKIPAKPRGGQFHYSDTNYVLLGLIIERATRQPLHRVFRKMIFEPLGMSDTWLSYREDRRNRVVSHRFEGREDLAATPRQSADWAGGGLISTAHDLQRFLQGLASGRLFAEASTLEEMRKAVPTGEEGITYGMGLYRVDLGDGRGEVWGHDGHGNSFAYYWPERGIYFTGTLNQTKNDWWPLLEAFVDGQPESKLIHAGEEKDWNAALSAGWDSLYMFRGVNALRDGGRYGSGIAWTDLNVTWSPTDEDAFVFDVWHCFATQGTAYRELDASIAYTRSIGGLELSVGYAFYDGYAPENFYSHELFAGAEYEIPLGAASLTPSLSYAYNLGPDEADGQGFAKAGSSFLVMRLDGRIPVWRDVLALEPWGAFGVNFQYNAKTAGDGEEVFFNGPNQLECGLAVPVQLSEHITLSAYAAYSRALVSLVETSPDTFWGGASISFSF